MTRALNQESSVCAMKRFWSSPSLCLMCCNMLRLAGLLINVIFLLIRETFIGLMSSYFSYSSVYEYGRFCETFHASDDGWRDCESCGKVSGKGISHSCIYKDRYVYETVSVHVYARTLFEKHRLAVTFFSLQLVHCGCIVSFNTYLLLDFGGIMCTECSKKNFILVRIFEAFLIRS